jgi:hypothetical protein
MSFMKDVLRALLLLVFLLCCWTVQGDTLYFMATADMNNNINYNFLSPNNWYVPNGMGGYTPVGRVPVSGDNAIVLSSTDGGANSINLLGMYLQPNVHVTAGSFSVGTLGTGPGSSFDGSTLEIRTAWFVTNGCSAASSIINVDSGAFVFLLPGSTALTLNSSTLYVVGQVVLAGGTMINFATGTNQFWIRPGAVVSGSGNTMLAANPNSGNFINFYFDGTLRGDAGLMNVSLGNGSWQSTVGLAKFSTSATNGVIEVHGAMTVPAGATNQVVGPGLTRFYGDSTTSSVLGRLEIGAIDDTSGLLAPGTLEMDRILSGPGVTQTVSSNGMPSTLIWGNGTISSLVNIDAYGRLFVTNAFSKILSGATINNSGLAQWDSDTGNIHLNNGAVFNNLAGATFDARNNAFLYGGVGALGAFNNAGLFKKSAGAGDTAVAQDNAPTPGAIFNNSGTVSAQSGRILLMEGTNSGAFNIGAGAQVRIGAFTNFQSAGSSFSGPGTLAVGGGSSAVLWLNVDCVVPVLDLESSSAVDGPGNLTVTQSLTMVATTVRGGGVMNISAGATVNATNSTSSNLSRDVNNAGAAVTGSTLHALRSLTWSNLSGGSLAFYGPSGGLDMSYSGAPPSFINQGSVSNIATNSPLVNWGFTNRGMVLVNPFGLNFSQEYLQTAGTTTVASASLLSLSKGARLTGGVLNGVGNIQGNVVNGATIHPGNSPGILSVSGNVTNNSSGILAVDIGGTVAGPGYSRLGNSFGQFAFDGALRVTFVNGFNPSLGDIFTVAAVTNGSRVGTFSSLQGMHAANGVVLVPVYGATNVSLVAASEPTLSSPVKNGNTATFTYRSTAGLTNVVEYATNIGSPVWIVLTNVAGDGSLKTIIDSAAVGSPRFYRVRFR